MMSELGKSRDQKGSMQKSLLRFSFLKTCLPASARENTKPEKNMNEANSESRIVLSQ